MEESQHLRKVVMWPQILYINAKDVAMVQKECSECNSGDILDHNQT